VDRIVRVLALALRRLENAQACNVPVRILERGGIALNVRIARLRAGAWVRIRVCCPITTKAEIEDDVLALEVGRDVASGAVNEVGVWETPLAGIEFHVLLSGINDVGGDGGVISCPEPNVDVRRGALHGEPTTAYSVQGRPVTGGVGRLDHTTRAISNGRVTVRSWRRRSGLVHGCRDHGTVSESVKNGCIGTLIIDDFEDIDLASQRPGIIIGICPKGGPGSASNGHMPEVENNNAVAIRLLT